MDFPEKVLLIDDDDEEHFIFKAALNECCKSTILIYEKSAQSALARMANGEPGAVPDLIILDWRMPLLSGKEVLTRIRKLPDYSRVPIVIFSGVFDPAHLEEAKDLGATFFLQKPFDLKELYRKMELLFSLDWRNTASSGRQL
ncbi:hypothetical protein A4D02_35255 [Niastella koreensis]|uniref:Response regulator receiver protein n=2 Tax=Niastella koreensis TaxID=354356 RepID=G8TBS4_NIAKG|nr:response regulator [Niastella koreensis]AEV98206.1 response regulator receiver protein [Niastella koreensis GR20-10]OQP44316.1 hypothetical protein A4D02_35255 [Niastella koreensis]